VIVRHALRSALIPVVTLGVLELGPLLSGACRSSRSSAPPGSVRLVVDSVFNRDYPLVQAVVLVKVYTSCSTSSPT